MTGPVLALTDQPTCGDETIIDEGLGDFNTQQVGYGDARPIAVLLKDPEIGATLGGMVGRTSYNLLFINLVYLPADQRGQDIGSRMLAMMEGEAITRGCKAGFLLTITSQSPGFYQRYGWTEFGRITCGPPGMARVFMTKTLTP